MCTCVCVCVSPIHLTSLPWFLWLMLSPQCLLSHLCEVHSVLCTFVALFKFSLRLVNISLMFLYFFIYLYSEVLNHQYDSFVLPKMALKSMWSHRWHWTPHLMLCWGWIPWASCKTNCLPTELCTQLSNIHFHNSSERVS